MTTQELKDKYMQLYDYMAVSNEPKYMKAFGRVMTEMFNWYATNKPDAAEEWLNKLEGIRWKNYLTTLEAERIVGAMNPKAPWTRDVWKNAMDSLGLPKEEYPCYNSCALWVEMNKQYSDHAETIARNILKKPLSEIPTEQIVTGIHAMALDVLKDKDGVYSIREYFGV